MAPHLSVVLVSLIGVGTATLPYELVELTDDESGNDAFDFNAMLLQVALSLKPDSSLFGAAAGSPTSAGEAEVASKSADFDALSMITDASHGSAPVVSIQTITHAYILWCIVIAFMMLAKPACNLLLSKVMDCFGALSGAESSAGVSSLLASQPGFTTTVEQKPTDRSVAEPYYPPPALPCETRLLDMLPSEDTVCEGPAIVGTTSGSPWTYAQLRRVMIAKVWDALHGYDVVALALPPGHGLAIALVCLLNKATCAPLDPNLSVAESAAALRQFCAKALVSVASAAPGAVEAAASLGLPSFALQTDRPEPDGSRALQLCALSACATAPPQQAKAVWNTTDDVALLLRTSGTTGKSKVVPLQLRQLVHGAKAIAASMDLNSSDACLNAMPLFHIGGISCNLLGSIISGGLVICCEKRFEPNGFAHLLMQGNLPKQPTWYYAVPSMHLALANAEVTKDHSLRLVRSGAAALPPLLQQRLEQMFECQVLATYSMTECMPIASPVLPRGDSPQTGPRCQPLGSVGRPIGPSVEVQNGEVMIRGALVTTGYKGADSGWTEQGLFPTGDLGRLDEHGFLWLQGRRKEVINQGAETLSPQELEDQVAGHKDVKEVAAYAVPHHRLGEAVALGVVLQSGQSTGASELTNIANDIATCLAPGRRPAAIVFMASLARTSTGKLQRLANPRVELSEGERRMVVVDARKTDSHGVPAVFRITPEPDTVAAIYSGENTGTLGSSKGEDEEMYDSMGLLLRVSQCQVFETRLFLDMYVIGLVGITLAHLGIYTCALQNLKFDLLVAERSWCVNDWHLDIFFVGAGYLDSKYNRELGWREVVMYLLLPAIPVVCQLLPQFIVSSLDWAGHKHPARWFFLCMLVCRFYVVGCSYMRVPRLVQAAAVVWFATWWQQAQIAVTFMCDPHAVLDYAMELLVPTFPYQNIEKRVHCFIGYVLAYLFLPGMVQGCISMGPRTVRRERLVGLLSWGLFIFGVTVSNRTRAYRYVTTAGWSLLKPFEMSELYIVVPLHLPLDFIRVCLLGAANVYLPLNLPNIVVNSLLGALLSMPLTLHPAFAQVIVNLTPRSASAEVQLCGLMVAFCIFLLVIAPLFQVLVMSVVSGIFSSATYLVYLHRPASVK